MSADVSLVNDCGEERKEEEEETIEEGEEMIEEREDDLCRNKADISVRHEECLLVA